MWGLGPFPGQPGLELAECQPLKIGLRGAGRTHHGNFGAGQRIDRDDLHRSADGGELEIDVARLGAHASTTTYFPSTLTGNVSALYGPSTSLAPGSTDTAYLRVRRRCGSHHDCPVRMSNSHECHGQRMISPLREY